ncbi:S-layer homology domain-containing protein [Lysinibacillus fusiformis]|uniref:S-layer homology domain-containing protein n=1 Tax=Lysinibacillus fusiformis TaxID=28031 RepID=UPI00380A1542
MGFASGYPDGTFKPNAEITESSFAKMLAKFLAIKVFKLGTLLSIWIFVKAINIKLRKFSTATHHLNHIVIYSYHFSG